MNKYEYDEQVRAYQETIYRYGRDCLNHCILAGNQVYCVSLSVILRRFKAGSRKSRFSAVFFIFIYKTVFFDNIN